MSAASAISTTDGRGGSPRVALVTYSSKPRGGVVHALSLAEALQAAGHSVHVFALGHQRFYRDTTAPYTLFAAPAWRPTLQRRVFAAIEALTAGLAEALQRFDVVHVQDCIAARAAARVRDTVAGVPVVRTVHHLDDFTTPSLVDCQHRSVREPDRVLAVSDHWRGELARLYGLDAPVVHNGVDARRFGGPAPIDAAALRARLGDEGRFVFLTVGGLEPRKGSYELIEALGRLRHRLAAPPALVVVGGHSFQDHRSYRERVRRRARQLGSHDDLVEVGVVSDEELISWYHAADAFAFPSVKEGWGLAVLEAMSAGLPVVASDIPVFREYLTHGHSALLPPAGDAEGLASALTAVAHDPTLRARLAAGGAAVARAFRWEAAADRHAELYREIAAAPHTAGLP
jgi:glycosyltransferase-like protein